MSTGFDSSLMVAGLTSAWPAAVSIAFHAAASLICTTRSHQLHRQTSPPRLQMRRWRAVSAKLTAASTAILCSTILAVQQCQSEQYPSPESLPMSLLGMLAGVLQLISSLSALLLHCIHSGRSSVSSDVLLVYWPVSLALSLLVLRSKTKLDSFGNLHGTALLPHVVFVFAAAFAFWAELDTGQPTRRHQPIYIPQDDRENDSGDHRDNNNTRCGRRERQHANIFSRWTFAWMTPLIDESYERACNGRNGGEAEMLGLPKKLAGNAACDGFFAAWDFECRAGTQQPRLLWLLVNGISHDLLVSGLYLAFSTMAQLLQPLLLKRVIVFFHQYRSVENVTLDDGLVLALGMGILGLVRTVTYQMYWHKLMQPYLWLVRVLSGLVYRKILRQSNESRLRHTTGEIVSYLSVDAEKLATAVNYVHCIWEYPLRVAIVMCALYRTLGYSAFGGVALLVANTHLSVLLAGLLGKQIKTLADSRDQRMRAVNETLANIKGIKLYSWQAAFAAKISRVRDTLELAALHDVGLWKSVMSLTSSLATVLISLATFATYECFDGVSRGPLTSQLIFVSMMLFLLLQEPVTESPTVIAILVSAARSFGRLQDLALSTEVVPVSGTNNARTAGSGCKGTGAYSEAYCRRATAELRDVDVAVRMSGATFKWIDGDCVPVLSNVDIECKRSELVAVIGRVGSGKSSLASAILGEMVKSAGSVAISGSVAYVPQQPWIMNATLRDNILFGSRFEQEFYDRVIDACALGPDLEMMSGGDMTEIGEKGINLSGGQKARVSLARAVYSRADIYILDDPLAAIDAHVGKHIFTHVLGPQSLLNTRARILVTNATAHILDCADRVYSLLDGRVFMEESATRDPAASQYFSRSASDSSLSVDETLALQQTPAVDADEVGTAILEPNPSYGIIKRENRHVGSVSCVTIWFYLDCCGRANLGALVATVLLTLVLSASSNIWLTRWADINDDNTRDSRGVLQRRSANPIYHLAIYGLLGTAGALSMAASALILWLRCSLAASRTTHKRMLHSVLRSPMSFFDSTPLGRILGLFGSDQTLTDDNVPAAAEAGIKAMVQVLVALFLVVISAPMMLIFFVPLSLVYINLQKFSLISVERIRKYSQLPAEAPEFVQNCSLSRSWPEQGMVEFKNYSTRYREGLDLVLRNLSFRVLPKQKVGIVGRTGAGKSSLTLALFRVIEAAGGQILIDGEDISQYGLYDVRSKLSIIPQDPVLFAGTVRENLDPFNSHSDQEIWCALEHAHLADVVRAKDEALEFMVAHGGDNFSVGQRQLVCLARALLKRAKVLVLDEATASIDNSTDSIIQESIRKEFKDCTVLTIAHRLNTIVDSDMILVIDGGKVAEYDTPGNLLADKTSLFAHLVEKAYTINSVNS
ncbi:P-loop containing nucleoside triphosphate hydrolase protein [Kickxella alabastrina]|uniref:P-loop containing nucleoside triphosphate hydrolase protein n=1 Tax=Kickxella alabastrina TaxID=61397 RepID=UPI00221E5E31|nr:P-loop containing nucleoside triphosphate hydrolase protein [Kickxella alabastrina]KAI7833448.1 P-loop containing nucleoside triphosphate hydrolase protein [Kickxella alabastrina]